MHKLLWIGLSASALFGLSACGGDSGSESDTTADMTSNGSADGATSNATTGTSSETTSPGTSNATTGGAGTSAGTSNMTSNATTGATTGAPDLEPTIAATVDHTEGLTPLTVSFDATIEGGDAPLEVMWSFGDGETSTDEDPSHTYTEAGTFTATVTVTDSDGDTDSAELTLTVEEDTAPTVSAVSDVMEGIAPLIVNFDATTEGGNAPVAIAWDLGDGNTSMDEDLSHTYTTAGTYTATVTVTDQNGDMDSAELTLTVEEDTAPTLAIAADVLEGVAPLTVSFDATAEGGNAPVAIAWDLGDGNTSMDEDPTHTYEAIGTFTATATVTDRNGDETSETITIDVADPGPCPNGWQGDLEAEQLAEFAESGCTVVHGNIELFNSDSVHLDELAALTTVTGGIEITWNTALTDLNGLASLRSAAGVYIDNNNALTDIRTLASLTSLNSLAVVRNDSLCWDQIVELRATLRATLDPNPTYVVRSTDVLGSNEENTGVCNRTCDNGTFEGDFSGPLAGLEGYTAVTGDLTIDGQDMITFAQLSCLTSVGGDLTIGDNPQLGNLYGLSALTTVGGELFFTTNPALEDVRDLSNLTSIGGDLTFWNNADLSSLDGLSIASLGGDLTIEGNPNLTDIQRIAGYTPGGDISIADNANLCQTRVDAVVARWNLAQLDATITTSGNAGPCPTCDRGTFTRSFWGDPAELEGYTAITGNLTVNGADLPDEVGELQDLDAFFCLTSVGGDLNIRDNAITDLDGFANLTEVGGELVIFGNTYMTNVDGLALITSAVDAYFGQNASLKDIDGLISLNRVEEDLTVSHGNYALHDVDGLSSLTEVGGSIRILNNDALSSVEGLSSLTAIGVSATIQNNANLCEDQVDALFSTWSTTMDPAPTTNGGNNQGPCEP